MRTGGALKIVHKAKPRPMAGRPVRVPLNRSALFKQAWSQARRTAANIGGTPRKHFRNALAMAWMWTERSAR